VGVSRADLSRVNMKANERQHVIQVGKLRIDRLRFEAKIHVQEIKLSRKEFDLLWTLAAENGRAFRREELIERVWGSGFFVDVRTVDVHIARLRTKLKTASCNGPCIETVWGIGYRLRLPSAL